MLLLALSWTAVGLGVACCGVIVVDNLVRGYRQPVNVMEVVWPVTALYAGPAAVVAYRKWGRTQSQRWRQRNGPPHDRPRHAGTLIQLFHCGAHCTLGAIIAETALFTTGLDAAGDRWWAEYAGDYSLAVIIGVAFRYSAGTHPPGRRIRAAIATVARIDLVSVTAFEFTLFVWLAVVDRVLFPAAPRPDSPVFWFVTQVGLIAGFIAAWPATSWLARRGNRLEPPGLPG